MLSEKSFASAEDSAMMRCFLFELPDATAAAAAFAPSFAFAFARVLMTTKARAVLSVHSSSRVNSFVRVTKSEEIDDDDDDDDVEVEVVFASATTAAASVGTALLSLVLSIVLLSSLAVVFLSWIAEQASNKTNCFNCCRCG